MTTTEQAPASNTTPVAEKPTAVDAPAAETAAAAAVPAASNGTDAAAAAPVPAAAAPPNGIDAPAPAVKTLASTDAATGSGVAGADITTKTTVAAETPLSKLTGRLPTMLDQVGHTEMWGVELSVSPDHAPSQVILQKFLRANNGDAAAAEKQLVAALEWRKKVNPAALVSEVFDGAKFGGLGYVTVHADPATGKETVITWNIYGSVKNNKATFGNVQEFIKWRAALMELGVQKLHLNDIQERIPEGPDAADPYQMLQVHDYQSVSFFRMDPDVKSASKETIQTFSTAYPELLAHKFFVNVPAIMGWVFGAMKFFLAPATLRKFHPMTSGTTLATELKGIVGSLPKEYGGQGPSVKDGETVKLQTTSEQPQGAKEDGPKTATVTKTEGEAKTPEAGKRDDAAVTAELPAAAPVEAKTDAAPVAASEAKTEPVEPVKAAEVEETKPAEPVTEPTPEPVEALAEKADAPQQANKEVAA
ncbi:Non-classical phosphatidylinositol transfer protein (PITP) [Purpureocillium takamizusanense]|uniref:Phosphatidylinositol transfer protein SFH5 n=1 Tax=Purpureocillium takamizusanense TaxID=2060973 RepID=A0A9Q8VEZ7_9HYPO|nr:Non-classical phosphatidylinositol transfer protein (PITP) [Purpureocillium takamizusanense]UNI22414.1 Non-classical phosphatidylinositol transfer protein (PITP) [Purpureocillium takamizusanense]